MFVGISHLHAQKHYELHICTELFRNFIRGLNVWGFIMFEVKMKDVGEYYALKTSKHKVALFFKMLQHLLVFSTFLSQISWAWSTESGLLTDFPLITTYYL